MDPKTRLDADLRFEAELRETGANDPRESYRTLLRELKERGGAEYELAVADFQGSVLESIAGGAGSPVRIWLEFGLRLAARLHPGRSVVVDAEGRARPYAPPPSWRELILHLPDDRKARAVPVGFPPELSSAQRATIDLLSLGKVKLGDS